MQEPAIEGVMDYCGWLLSQTYLERESTRIDIHRGMTVKCATFFENLKTNKIAPPAFAEFCFEASLETCDEMMPLPMPSMPELLRLAHSATAGEDMLRSDIFWLAPTKP